MLPYRILSVANRIMLVVSIISGTVLPTTLTQAYKTTPRALSREEGTQEESQQFLHSLSEDRGDGFQSVPPSFPPQDFDDQDNLIVDEPPEPVIFELSAEPVKEFYRNGEVNQTYSYQSGAWLRICQLFLPKYRPGKNTFLNEV